MPDTVTLIDQDGNPRDVPESEAAAALSHGWRARTESDVSTDTSRAALENDYGGVSGAIRAAGVGALRGVTLGASDVALRALGGQEATTDLRQLRALNPAISGLSEFGGALLPALATGGASAAESAAGGIGRRILSGTPAALTSDLGHAVG